MEEFMKSARVPDLRTSEMATLVGQGQDPRPLLVPSMQTFLLCLFTIFTIFGCSASIPRTRTERLAVATQVVQNALRVNINRTEKLGFISSQTDVVTENALQSIKLVNSDKDEVALYDFLIKIYQDMATSTNQLSIAFRGLPEETALHEASLTYSEVASRIDALKKLI
jgi:hypothetical protein